MLPVSDFTYSSYINMLKLIQNSGYSFASYHNYANYDLPCIMRHDIDFDVNAALRLAKRESEFSQNLTSTFFVLLSSNLYNVFSRETASSLNSILTLGHEIGLHFDETKYDCIKPESTINAVHEEAYILGKMLGIKIRAVSMHRPSKRSLEADLRFKDMQNSYSQVFTREFKYLSDSRMHWRENVEELIASQEYNKLHILTHPFWYSEEREATKEKLLRFITGANQERYDHMRSNFMNMEEFVHSEEVLP